MRKLLPAKWRSRRGAAMIEYGMLVGLIAVLGIGAVMGTGMMAKETFCVSAESLASARGSEGHLECDDVVAGGAGGGATLPDGAEAVDDPVQALASFEDVLFERDETGGRVLLASMPDPAPQAYDLDIAISGRDALATGRALSACYRGAGDTICSASGEVASIEVPVGVSEIGLRVDLPSDVTQAWENDVTISTAAVSGYSPGMWGIDVSREAPLPVFNVSYDLASPTYETNVTGDQYVWAEISGERNVSGTFADWDDDDGKFETCYRMDASSEPVCAESWISVPVDATQLGYLVHLPDEKIADDTVLTSNFRFYTGNFVGNVSDAITVTRKNTPKVFDPDYDLASPTYETDVTGDQYVWADITGERNVWGTFTNLDDGDGNFDACYRMDASSEPVCAVGWVSVPVDATQVGYIVHLPGEKIAEDTVLTSNFRFYATGVEEVVNDTITVTRKNTPKVFAPAYDLASPTYEKDITGDQYVWADITGERNVWGTFTNWNDDYGNFDACYRMDASSDPVCAVGWVSVPVDATQVGYIVHLPGEKIADDTVLTANFRFYANGLGEVERELITVTRKNTPQVFAPAYDLASPTFEADVTGEQYVWATVGGERNINGIMHVWNLDYDAFDACYRMEVGAEPQCAAVNITVPPDAEQVGYLVRLPAAKTGDDTVRQTKSRFFSSGFGEYERETITVTRKNTPAD